jgi:hypothetical protein
MSKRPSPDTGLFEQGAELFYSFNAQEQARTGKPAPFHDIKSQRWGQRRDRGRPAARLRPSLFKPIRGIVRGTDSRYRRRAQHMKKHAKTIEIKY